MSFPDFRLTPARRIKLKQSGVRLKQIIARLAALDAEYKRIHSGPPTKPR
jgi:hypothetical protein